MPALEFKGKPFVYPHHLSVPFREMIVDADKSLPSEGSNLSLDDNLIIHDDNLEALKALLPRYAGPMSAGDAINLLRLHRAAVKGGRPRRYGWRRQKPDIETVRTEIMRKLEATRRKRG